MGTRTQKGVFIVIEGTDGSGKGTQVGLLTERLKNEGVSFEVADFPQYDKPSSFFAQKYLRGEYGTADEVGPYRASVFYALDRYDKSFEIKKWLAEGKVVVCNRYVSANMGHQAGKIANKTKRRAFLSWLKKFEYDLFGIPKPDVTIFLKVPPKVAQAFVDQKGVRTYTTAKRDIHEADLVHLERAAIAYIQVAKAEKWQVIDCTHNGIMYSLDEVAEKIWDVVARHISVGI